MSEHALLIDFDGDQLVAVLSLPGAEAVPPQTGVVIVVGGPQYRVGSHRQFVHMARGLSDQGMAALRFDVRGMGDATGSMRSFESLDDDIGAAVRTMLQAVPSLRHVALLGLCDGASAVLLHVDRGRVDACVRTLILLNPWVRSEQTLAKAQVSHYYADRLRDRAFWAKLLRGGVSWRSPFEYVSKWRASRSNSSSRRSAAAADDSCSFQSRMARAWGAWGGAVLLVVSGRDLTAAEFTQLWQADPSWHAARSHPRTLRLDLPSADHTLSAGADHDACLRWLADRLSSHGDVTHAKTVLAAPAAA